jgi:hypothetical protein
LRQIGQDCPRIAGQITFVTNFSRFIRRDDDSMLSQTSEEEEEEEEEGGGGRP